jgi:hypothetical protein
MKKKIAEVMRHRSELLTRIAAQREQMIEIGKEWQAPLALAERGVAAVTFLRRRHPLLVAGMVVALFVIRRRSLTGLVAGVWGIWKGYRSLASLSAKLLAKD